VIENKRLSGVGAQQAAAERQAAEHDQAERQLAELEDWAASQQPGEAAGNGEA